MGKWLAAGAVALLVLMALLWTQIHHGASAVAVSKPAAPRVAEAVDSPGAAAYLAHVQPIDAGNGLDPAAPTPPLQPGKIDPRSDAFFEKFDEVVPRRLTENAAKCYEGRHGTLHRNQKLSLMFKTKVVNGVVSVLDVKIKENTLNDSALENCFIQQVQGSSWKDDELPDWEQDDQLVLRPERGMKKYWKDNINATGPEAPPL